MDVKLKVQRFDPDGDKRLHYDEYAVAIPDYATVLDGLIQIREDVDETLAVRCSCRSAICGSCMMRIDGQARLACKTKIVDIAKDGEPISVEPGGNLPLIKDLVVDMEPFWAKVRAVKPWIEPEGPPPEREYVVANEFMEDLVTPMGCIMCGACVSDCTVLAVDKSFLGPAALAKAYRVVGDPRDSHHQERLVSLSAHTGIWDCTHCFQCVEVCPKGVAPMERILDIRRKAMDAGITNNNGSRHAEAFVSSVKNNGWLDELRLPIKSFGIFNIPAQIKMLPLAIRAARAGKVPSPFHHRLPKVAQVTSIFDKISAKTSSSQSSTSVKE